MANEGAGDSAGSGESGADATQYTRGDIKLIDDTNRPTATALCKALETWLCAFLADTSFTLVGLKVVDESAAHEGDAGALEMGLTGESHFSVEIVAPEFAGLTPVQRQQKVYESLSGVMSRIHALSLVTRTPEEAREAQCTAPLEPALVKDLIEEIGRDVREEMIRRTFQTTKDFHDSLLKHMSEMQNRLIEEMRRHEDKINALYENKQLPWQIPGYRVGEFLGTGAYGSVRKGVLISKKQPAHVAIKRMSQIFTWIPADCKRALREIAILSTVKHENIVKIHDVVAPNCIDTFDDIYMVMEACDSDLDKLFHAEVMLAPNRIKKLLHTLLCGLKYLHWAGIWHRDLKPANCLLNQSARDARKNWSIKICDFGLSRAFDGEPDRADPKRLRRDLTDHVVTRALQQQVRSAQAALRDMHDKPWRSK
eukprot:s3912_g5.t1